MKLTDEKKSKLIFNGKYDVCITMLWTLSSPVDSLNIHKVTFLSIFFFCFKKAKGYVIKAIRHIKSLSTSLVALSYNRIPKLQNPIKGVYRKSTRHCEQNLVLYWNIKSYPPLTQNIASLWLWLVHLLSSL